MSYPGKVRVRASASAMPHPPVILIQALMARNCRKGVKTSASCAHLKLCYPPLSCHHTSVMTMCSARDTYASVCTSTLSTAGRSRTIGFQLSPASADAYTCPPVVPKYTPQLSRVSTAMASRSTFT